MFRALYLFVSLFALVSSVVGATIYTDQTSFLDHVQSGYYLETFDSLPETPVLPPPLFFSMNGFSYIANTADDFYTIGGSLSTSHQAFDIILTLTSGNVMAVGAQFFLGTPVLDPNPVISVSLNDGTTLSLSNPPAGFIGFTSDSPIQSMEVSAPRGGFAGVNDLITGGVVPEPASSVLLTIGLVGFAALRISAPKN